VPLRPPPAAAKEDRDGHKQQDVALAPTGLEGVFALKSWLSATARLPGMMNSPLSTAVKFKLNDCAARTRVELLVTATCTPPTGAPNGIWKLICVGPA
jgi:hypothetical protein